MSLAVTYVHTYSQTFSLSHSLTLSLSLCLSLSLALCLSLSLSRTHTHTPLAFPKDTLKLLTLWVRGGQPQYKLVSPSSAAHPTWAYLPRPLLLFVPTAAYVGVPLFSFFLTLNFNISVIPLRLLRYLGCGRKEEPASADRTNNDAISESCGHTLHYPALPNTAANAAAAAVALSRRPCAFLSVGPMPSPISN